MATDRPATHPSRRKLAAGGKGDVFDRLLDAQQRLERGECGTLKPISLTSAQLARIANLRPRDISALTRLVGDRPAERFGAAFLDILTES